MSAAGLAAEAAKLPAFVRRDWKIALSYRAVFVSDVLGLAMQVIVFFFVAKLVDPGKLPVYGATVPSYLAFVVIGLVVNLTAGVLLFTVANALRQEQLTGTFEALLATPTSGATLQFGSVAYTLILRPDPRAVLLTAIGLLFGLDLELSGIAPAVMLLIGFLPVHLGARADQRRPRGHVPARPERDRHGGHAARADLRRGLPDRAAAAVPAHGRRVEPVRDLDRRRSATR